MKIAAYVHLYTPQHNAGAEWMLHSILRWMVERGHEARVVYPGARRQTFQGVRIEPLEDPVLADLHEWADIAFTHLDLTRAAIKWAGDLPLVHLVHNHLQLRHGGVQHADLVVFNTEWLQKRVRWPGKALVVHPPVFADDYRTKPGDDVTLINLTRQKGAHVFRSLARHEPERTFLGVRGAYGHQVEMKHMSNVRVINNRPDAKEIYAKTRVLLMPSSYESYGRTAVEAAASGIPVICSATPGLRESMSEAAIFVTRQHPRRWRKALHLLDDPDEYAEWSEKARKRSEFLDPTFELEDLETELEALV